MKNAKRNRRICELRGVKSASLIAKELGCSRNAVIGVWFRNGYRDGVTAPKSGQKKPKQMEISAEERARRAEWMRGVARRYWDEKRGAAK